MAQVALAAVAWAGRGDCVGDDASVVASDSIRSAFANGGAYFAFSHKKKTAPDQIPAMRLYVIDESQSLFIYLSDDR